MLGSILHSDIFLGLATVVCGAAIVTKHLAPPHTVAYQVADVVTEACIGLGVFSTTGREQK